MACNKLISIIVPVYNAEKYLDDCIGSIVNQTYTDIEILLVDDGSTDSSGEICRKWENTDRRIKVIHQENGGVSKARNTGIDRAEGELLLMADSDDYIASDMVETLLEVFDQSNADIVICDYEQGENRTYIFAPEETVYQTFSFEEVMSRVYADGHDALRFISPWGKLYRKDLFEDIHYPDGKIFEDIYITHQLLYQAKTIAVTDRKLVYYYRHEDSIMHKPFHLGKLDYLDALKERIDFFRSHELKQLEKTAYEEYLHSLIWEYSRVRDILHDDDAKKAIRTRFHVVYKDGYSSKKYPQETAAFLKSFDINPELIVFYWKVNAKLKRATGDKK